MSGASEQAHQAGAEATARERASTVHLRGAKRHRLTAELDRLICARVRKLRRAAGISCKTLAKALKVSPSQVLKIETGRNRFHAAHLPIIAEVLGTTVDALFISDTGTAPEPGAAEKRRADFMRDAFRIRDAAQLSILLELTRALVPRTEEPSP